MMASFSSLLVLALTGASASVAWLVSVSALPAQQPQTYPFTLDFETGTLRGWTATGTAFVSQPTLGDNPTARGRGQPSHHQGRYWIGTFERYQGRAGQKPGGIQGDAPQGTLTSATFVIPSDSLTFLVGGGASPATRVELDVYDQIENVWTTVFRVSGTNSETMSRVSRDLRKVAGRRGRIVIVDASSARWGHINVDDFRFVGHAPAPQRPTLPFHLPHVDQTHVNKTQVIRVKAPPLARHSLQEAKVILEKHRLVLGSISRRLSSQPVGTVIEQVPPPNSVVAVASTVSVTLAAGVPVPDVRRRTVQQAREMLVGARLRAGSVSPEPSELPPGTILRSEPPAGKTVPLGTTVGLVGAAGITVPNVVGRNVREARQVIQKVGLAIGAVEKRPSSRAPGTVLEQSRSPESVVPLRTSLNLVVASGVPVPTLVQRPLDAANELLVKSRLQLGRVEKRTSNETVGTVIDQDPAPDSLVPVGSFVSVVVAAGVTVPDLRGLAVQQAETLLSRTGLRLDAVRREASALPSGTVIDQKPQPGVAVPLRTPVTVLQAEGVNVPNVVGRNTRQASRAIDSAGLRVGAVTSRPSSRAPGTVLAQGLDPRAVVPLQTAIDLVVAAGITVPNVVGRDSASAVGLVRRARLLPGTIARRPSAESAGTVLGQSPRPGDQAALGSAVDLVLAASVPVPNVVNQDRAHARDTLSHAGLVFSEAHGRLSFEPSGTVLAQEPAPPAFVPIGTVVRLTVARHVPPAALAGVMLALLAVGALLVRSRTRPEPPPKPRPNGPGPRIEVVAHPDPGRQTLERGASPAMDVELRIRAIVDAGEQRIETPGPLLEDDRNE